MKTTKTILLLLLFYCSAVSGDIGFTKVILNDDERSRELETYIWYPSDHDTEKVFAENVAFRGFSASVNAPVSKSQLPLYILIHGASGNWRNMSWLAAKLAKNAIVVSANHPGYTSGQASPGSVIKIWDQPKDVSFLIDNILESNTGAS